MNLIDGDEVDQMLNQINVSKKDFAQIKFSYLSLLQQMHRFKKEREESLKEKNNSPDQLVLLFSKVIKSEVFALSDRIEQLIDIVHLQNQKIQGIESQIGQSSQKQLPTFFAVKSSQEINSSKQHGEKEPNDVSDLDTNIDAIKTLENHINASKEQKDNIQIEPLAAPETAQTHLNPIINLNEKYLSIENNVSRLSSNKQLQGVYRSKNGINYLNAALSPSPSLDNRTTYLDPKTKTGLNAPTRMSGALMRFTSLNIPQEIRHLEQDLVRQRLRQELRSGVSGRVGQAVPGEMPNLRQTAPIHQTQKPNRDQSESMTFGEQ